MKIKQTTTSFSNSFQESFSLQLEPTNTITKLIIDNFKQLADSIDKSNTTVQLI